MFFDRQIEPKVKRQVFFSFEYLKDGWRASQVRNMGVVDGTSTFCDNDWETIGKDSELVIKRWINKELEMRSCLIVLVGETTAERKWIIYEIRKAYEMGKGIFGIRIHNLKDQDGNVSVMGVNPFDCVFANNGHPLSEYVQLYNPTGGGVFHYDSTRVYEEIKSSISDWIEEALSDKAPL